MSEVKNPLRDEKPLHYLLGSEYRIMVLKALASEPNDPITISRTYDIPRSSLHRTIQELESKGWIARNSSRLRLEPLGQYILTLYTHIESEINAITTATLIAQWVTLDVDHIPILCDSEVSLRGDQPKPLEVLFEWVKENNRFKAYFPKMPALFDQFLVFTSELRLSDATIYLSQNGIDDEEYVGLRRAFDGRISWTSYNSDFGILFDHPKILLIGIGQDGIIQAAVSLDSDCADRFGEKIFTDIQEGICP